MRGMLHAEKHHSENKFPDVCRKTPHVIHRPWALQAAKEGASKFGGEARLELAENKATVGFFEAPIDFDICM